jgi:signal transduction histidine kinase
MSDDAPRRTTRPGNSLYWRIALGLVASLALMVLAQGALFLWAMQRTAGETSAESPRQLALLVASDVGAALAADSALDIERYVRDQYARRLQTFLIVLADGRTVSNHDDVPQALLDAVEASPAITEFLRGRPLGGRRGRGRFAIPEDRRSPFPPGPGSSPPPEDPMRAPLRAARLLGGVAPILVEGRPVGRVAVLPGRPPFTRVLRELGPTMALVALGVLAGGAALIALVVVAPVRRRLTEVQVAADRLGGGDLGARAPEHGSDEVAALAHAFNRMADELARRTKALESSDAARRHLLADVSHELMTPLTSMRGYIETLGMPEIELDAATRQRYLGVVSAETYRLERLIGDLLELARLEGGGGSLRRDMVDLRDLVEHVATRHQRDLHDRRVELAVTIGDGASHVIGDPDRLEQVLQNLAANALRHTPAGGTVSIVTRRQGPDVEIVVHDTGPGIPAEHLPSIFDRFYKGDAARSASSGSGLGLSIVKAIVERHGGTVTAANDGGAAITIRLPDHAGASSATARSVHDS